jgi:hypothetical protein
VGTGGRSHTFLSHPQPNSEVRNSDTYGVLKLTLSLVSSNGSLSQKREKHFAIPARVTATTRQPLQTDRALNPGRFASTLTW